MELDFWIRVVEVPVIAAMIAVIWGQQRQISDLRLEVAKNYIDRAALEHLEERLIERLKSIEQKLERWINRCAPAAQRGE